MGQASTGAEALIDILNLCDQALSALSPEPAMPSPGANSDPARRHGRRLSATRLTLIKGGLRTDSTGPQLR
jgi:hypothetical protein